MKPIEMKRHALSLTLRLLVFAAPLLLLFWYANNAFEYAKTQERHGDTGLGIAILLGLITLAMLLGFSVDLLIQIARKRWFAALVDAAILLALLMPFGWFACNWYGLTGHPACWLPLNGFGRVLEALNV